MVSGGKVSVWNKRWNGRRLDVRQSLVWLCKSNLSPQQLTNCKLYEDGKEEEDGLVDCSEVDPAVEADQEDQLDQQGGVDDGVGEA